MPIFKLERPLPHRNRNVDPTLIVLHATAGGTARSSIDHLRGVGLSYHFIIARDGRDSARSDRADRSDSVIFHCAPEKAHCFHVGSTVPAPSGAGGINKHSIGISLANLQRDNGPDRYTPQQIDALDGLVRAMIDKFPIRWIAVHRDLQPWNRSDPLGMTAREAADRFGLEAFVPTDDVVREHRPRRARVA